MSSEKQYLLDICTVAKMNSYYLGLYAQDWYKTNLAKITAWKKEGLMKFYPYLRGFWVAFF